MKSLTILGCSIAAGVISGLLVVKTCQNCDPQPKMCGLLFFYSAPIGAIAGAVAGSVLDARGQHGE